MLFVDIISTRASNCASTDSGTCTAIWSPSKSALNAVHTSGCQVDGLALHQYRLEGLDAQPMQGGSPVQQHRVLADHLLQDVPDLRHLEFGPMRFAFLIAAAWP